MGEIRYELRSLEARQNWHFKCPLFRNYWTDLLEIFTESAKVYSHCVCEISKPSKPNHSFEDQKIGKSYKNSSSFNTWVTVVKQSWIIASMSSNNRIFLDILRSLSLLGKSGAIQIRILNIYINVINDHSSPLFIFFFVSDYLSVFYQCFISVWEFSNLLWLNFGMSALSERSFVCLFVCL